MENLDGEEPRKALQVIAHLGCMMQKLHGQAFLLRKLAICHCKHALHQDNVHALTTLIQFCKSVASENKFPFPINIY